MQFKPLKKEEYTLQDTKDQQSYNRSKALQEEHIGITSLQPISRGFKITDLS